MKEQGIQIIHGQKMFMLKVPVSNSKGIIYGKIIKDLNNQNIKLNITAVYSANQTEKNFKS